MLIKMIDGGIVNYMDDCDYYEGCPTCGYGSKYINEIDIWLTKFIIHVSTSKMYDYVLSERQMMKLFLYEYNTIQQMTETEFVDWFKMKLCEIADDELDEDGCGRLIKCFDVEEV